MQNLGIYFRNGGEKSNYHPYTVLHIMDQEMGFMENSALAATKQLRDV